MRRSGHGIPAQVLPRPAADCGWVAARAIQHELIRNRLRLGDEARSIRIRAERDEVSSATLRTFHAMANDYAHRISSVQEPGKRERPYLSRFVSVRASTASDRF